MQVYSDQTCKTSCHPLSTERIRVYCDADNKNVEKVLRNAAG